MSERAVTTTWMLGGQSSVYLHEDRLEVGTTDVVFHETLARVAYRDARQLVAWSATRLWHLWIGVAVLLVTGVLGVTAIASLTGGGGSARDLLGIPVDVWPAILAAAGLGVAAGLTYMGRPGGITKFRLDGARGHVEGVLSGSRRKREALIAEIERRIHDRQTSREA